MSKKDVFAKSQSHYESTVAFARKVKNKTLEQLTLNEIKEMYEHFWHSYELANELMVTKDTDEEYALGV